MGDNSVDMIPPALDNGEPNSTMANQIAYSPKETILEEYFCIQMLPSSFETKWCSIILCKFAFNLYVNCCYVPGVTRRLRKPTSWLASNKLCLKFNKFI